MNDIDLSEFPNWRAIGINVTNTTIPFCGVFDGNNKTISGLKILPQAPNSQGLFQVFGGGARVFDLTVEGDVTARTCAGLLAGYASGGIYTRITARGKVLAVSKNGEVEKDETCGYAHAAGVIGRGTTQAGQYEDMEFNECVNYAAIQGHGACAGIISEGIPSLHMNFAAIGPDDILPITKFYRCFNYGNISGGRSTAGIAGVVSYGWHQEALKYPELFRPSVFVECLSDAEITVSDIPGSYYGGITAGYSNQYRGLKLERCVSFNRAKVVRDPLDPTLVNSRNNGGLIGIYCYENEIYDSYVGGTLDFGPDGGWPSGGIASQLNPLPTSYGPGNVQRVFQNANFINTATDTGGLVGLVTKDGTIGNCYFNKDRMTGASGGKLFGRTNSAPTTFDNAALTEEECTDRDNFKNFDFDNVWGIHPDVNGGMPFLRWAAKYYPGGENFNTPTPTPTETATPTPPASTETPTPTDTQTATSPTAALPTPTATVTGSPPTQTVDPLKPGDANCDGKVNIDDILLVRDVIFGVKFLIPQGYRNLGLEETGRASIDQILLIRDIIFGAI